MKWFKRLLTIVLPILIAASAIMMVLLTLQYANNRGKIEGTGFVNQEVEGAGGIRFDVDDYGNLYFAVPEQMFNAAIVVYNNLGKYLYTLPIRTSGGIGVIIDKENNILVYDVREEIITKYDNKGILRSYENDYSYSLHQFFPFSNDNVRERNGIRYINNGGTITKVENGVETIVFTVPVWQQWYRAFKLILIFSAIGLFLRIGIPLWIKAFKQRKLRNGHGLE